MPWARATLANDASTTHSTQYLLALVMFVPRRVTRAVFVRVRRALLRRGVVIPLFDRQPFVVVALPAAEILEELEVRRRILRRGRAGRRGLCRGRRLRAGRARETQRAKQYGEELSHHPTP